MEGKDAPEWSKKKKDKKGERKLPTLHMTAASQPANKSCN